MKKEKLKQILDYYTDFLVEYGYCDTDVYGENDCEKEASKRFILIMSKDVYKNIGIED